jgi:hypothetical protein
MISIDIDVRNNIKVLQTIIDELLATNNWNLRANANHNNPYWKDLPNKCPRFFSFNLENVVFSWKCHDNLNPSDTLHIPTCGHALELLESVFAIQDKFEDKNYNHYLQNLDDAYVPDILASITADDPCPPETIHDNDTKTYCGDHFFKIHQNPCDNIDISYKVNPPLDFFYSMSHKIENCQSIDDAHHLMGKLHGLHSEKIDELKNLLNDKIEYLKQKKYHEDITLDYGSYGDYILDSP